VPPREKNDADTALMSQNRLKEEARVTCDELGMNETAAGIFLSAYTRYSNTQIIVIEFAAVIVIYHTRAPLIFISQVI
jgi:hypothetical protein